jgi:uncharacterized repeat protein (TIGR01451 family)
MSRNQKLWMGGYIVSSYSQSSPSLRGLWNAVITLIGVFVSSHATIAGAAAANFVEIQSNGASGVTGLGGVSGLAVSPDGQYLYGVGATDNAITVFQRDPATGRLIYIESRKVGGQQADDAGPISGLTTPLRTVISPDGLQLYTISGQDGSVAVFSRNSATGRLTYRQTIAAGGLTLARAIGGSPDGAYLYVAGEDANSTEHLAVFRRDAGNGDLTVVTQYIDHTANIDGLGYASTVLVSPDGKNVYVSGSADAAIAVFSRDAASGELSLIQTLANNQQDDLGVKVVGLDGVYGISVSPEGSQVYATSDVDEALVVLRRNPATGRLTFAEELQNNQGGVDGLSKVLDIAGSPDGQYLYTAAADQSKIGVFGLYAAALDLVLSADAAIANTGLPLDYTLTVTNQGPSDATDAVVSDELPAAMNYISAVPSQGTCGNVDKSVTCRLTTLAEDATATVMLRAAVAKCLIGLCPY